MSLQKPLNWYSKPISQDGVYALPMSVYHADCCDRPSISSSGLRTIWTQSPAHYFYESPYNPNRPEDEDDRPHFSIGRAAHHLLFLGRKGFEEEFATRPEQWSDWRSKDAKLWREDAIARGLTVITENELELIAGMARSLAAHPMVKAGILDGYVERSLIWKEPGADNVWLKSRPDCIPNDSGDFSDLKTCVSVGTDELRKHIASFGYHMQGALAGMACKRVLDRDLQSFTLVFVEKSPPHCVRVVTLRPEDLVRGENQIRAAVDMFAASVASGSWPGPGGDHGDAEFLDLPEYARKSIDHRLETIAQLEPA
jgi:hypothetical protein